MSQHRYILEPYKGMKTRFCCPSCNRPDKTFSLYIDTETGKHVNATVGRCNRESNCGYHYTPKQYFQDNNISFDPPQPKVYKPKAFALQTKPVSFINTEVFKQSLQSYDANYFVKFLLGLFGTEKTTRLIETYFIGTSKHWPGATVFWQIDQQRRVRTGKIMLYSSATGKRVREPYNHINWVHTAIKQPEFELAQCIFGEHLLIDKTKPVAIVESEKTAVIASVYLPQFIWLAVGSLTNLNAEKCSILKGRTVILFPDLNGFDKWSSKAKELSQITTFIVSDLLERKATIGEKKQGFDLADYLIQVNYKAFAMPEPPTKQPPAVKQLVKVNHIETISNYSKPESWEQDITTLEKFFAKITLPTQPVKMNAYSTIGTVQFFIEAHLTVVKAHNGNRTFLPYLNRLQELKQYLTLSKLEKQSLHFETTTV